MNFITDKSLRLIKGEALIKRTLMIRKESHIRSVLKGVTWRFIATTTTVVIAYIITGEVGDALKIGGIEFLAKIGIYYLHERMWLLVPQGGVRKIFGVKK